MFKNMKPEMMVAIAERHLAFCNERKVTLATAGAYIVKNSSLISN